jgi:hypothetical protein
LSGSVSVENINLIRYNLHVDIIVKTVNFSICLTVKAVNLSGDVTVKTVK